MNVGDVHWVDFPSRGGHEQAGRRPAIVAQVAAASHQLLVSIASSPGMDDIGLSSGRPVSLRETASLLAPRWIATWLDPRPPPLHCCALASTLSTERHSCRSGRTTHGSAVSYSAWHTPIACAGVVVLYQWGFWPFPACPRTYLLAARSKQGPFPPARYLARLHRYYGPLGLPPGSSRFRPSGFIRSVFA